jgi:hypothetical protein
LGLVASPVIGGTVGATRIPLELVTTLRLPAASYARTETKYVCPTVSVKPDRVPAVVLPTSVKVSTCWPPAEVPIASS